MEKTNTTDESHGIALFDYLHPSDTSVFGRVPDSTRGEIGMRFQSMREMITLHKATISQGAKTGKEKSYVETVGTVPAQESDNANLRWEQMICQLGVNAVFLLNKFAPNVFVKPGCSWNSDEKIWEAHTNQCVDIGILAARIDEDNEDYDEYVETFGEENLDDDNNIVIDYETALIEEVVEESSVKYIGEIMGDDGLIKHYVYVSKTGVLAHHGSLMADFGRHHDNPIVFCKVGVPGHYTMALVYLKEKRIEFFDSGGTYDAIGWENDDPNKPYSATLERLRTLKKKQKGRKGRKSMMCLPEEYTYEIDSAVCKAFNMLFSDYHLVGINRGLDLQVDNRDAHCQTWIWLYAYLKFVKPRASTRNLGILLHAFTRGSSKKKSYSPNALLMIESFWNYLIYLEKPGFTLEGGNLGEWAVKGNTLQFIDNMRGGNTDSNWIIKNNRLYFKN